MTTLKTALLVFGAYLLASIGTIAYLAYAGLATWGDPCFSNSYDRCSLATITYQYLTPFIFGVLALTLQALFFRNKLHRKFPQIFVELAYIIPLIYVSYLVGNKIVNYAAAHKINPNTATSDTATIYIAIICGILTCILISCYLQSLVLSNRRVYEKIKNASYIIKNKKLRVFTMLLLTTGVVISYFIFHMNNASKDKRDCGAIISKVQSSSEQDSPYESPARYFECIENK
jgi:hypothetical protein